MPVLDLPNYYMASLMTSSSLSVMIATQTKLIFLPKEIKTYVIKAKLEESLCPHSVNYKLFMACAPTIYVKPIKKVIDTD